MLLEQTVPMLEERRNEVITKGEQRKTYDGGGTAHVTVCKLVNDIDLNKQIVHLVIIIPIR